MHFNYVCLFKYFMVNLLCFLNDCMGDLKKKKIETQQRNNRFSFRWGWIRIFGSDWHLRQNRGFSVTIYSVKFLLDSFKIVIFCVTHLLNMFGVTKCWKSCRKIIINFWKLKKNSLVNRILSNLCILSSRNQTFFKLMSHDYSCRIFLLQNLFQLFLFHSTC